jgi:hypothetical protein
VYDCNKCALQAPTWTHKKGVLISFGQYVLAKQDKNCLQYDSHTPPFQRHIHGTKKNLGHQENPDSSQKSEA